MNTITAASPMMQAILPASMESAPRSGPTVRSSRIFIGAGSAPARSRSERSLASSTVKLPVICPLPPTMGSRITGALMTRPSSTMAKGLPTFSVVTSPNLRAPVESKRKLTAHCPVWSRVVAASTSESPLTMTRLRTT